MNREHHYRVRAQWTGNLGEGTTNYRSYTRDVTLSAADKPDLEASSDNAFHGDRHRWNPEDLLVAALSECHLLSYLHAAVVAGVNVVTYTDEATGLMRQDSGNGGAFVEVTLRPQVTVADPATIDAAVAAHETAHEWCFIANSVNFPVHVEPTVVAA